MSLNYPLINCSRILAVLNIRSSSKTRVRSRLDEKNRILFFTNLHFFQKISRVRTFKHMKRKTTTAVQILALAGSASLLGSASSLGAFANLPSPTNETPGVLLDPNTLGLTGTVLAVQDSPFVDNASPTPFAKGTLRSFVVDRDPTAGVALDFYYQLINTTIPSIPPDPDQEFYRLKTTGGFDPSLVVSVAQTNSLSGLTAGIGSGFVAGSYTTGATLKPTTTADRDVGTLGSVGFDFPVQPPIPFTDDPRNIGAGQLSSFLLVRTNSTTFGLIETRVSGAATSFAAAFAAVPEPSSALFGLALLGTALTRRRK